MNSGWEDDEWRVLEGMLSWSSVESAARAAGVSPRTVWRWRRDDPSYREAMRAIQRFAMMTPVQLPSIALGGRRVEVVAMLDRAGLLPEREALRARNAVFRREEVRGLIRRRVARGRRRIAARRQGSCDRCGLFLRGDGSCRRCRRT